MALDKKNLINKAVLTLAKVGIAPTTRGGKMVFDTNQKPGGPWVYARYSKHNCTLLKTFIFDLISKNLPKKDQFIPTECLNCYKVVARPETFEQLLELKEIQKKMDLPSKCGIEKRESVDALYGGYWYCTGLEEGIGCLNQVREALFETCIPSFLKRGCTEYELYFGPSDQWGIKPGQRGIEDEVFKRVAIDNYKRPQSETEVKNIMNSWKAFAVELGPDYKGSHNYITYGD